MRGRRRSQYEVGEQRLPNAGTSVPQVHRVPTATAWHMVRTVLDCIKQLQTRLNAYGWKFIFAEEI